jgi:hypothetical protein
MSANLSAMDLISCWVMRERCSGLHVTSAWDAFSPAGRLGTEPFAIPASAAS